MVLGADDERTLVALHEVFDSLMEASGAPVVETGTPKAEMVKYANDGFVTSKGSSINDLGNVGKEFGVDTAMSPNPRV